jgi:hypothetical protein
MAPHESKIYKQAVDGTTRHVTLTIPDTSRKPGSATTRETL